MPVIFPSSSNISFVDICIMSIGTLLSIEVIRIEKAKEIAKNADLVIYIIDSSKKLEEEDKEILKSKHF